jgi:hypothetical protein
MVASITRGPVQFAVNLAAPLDISLSITPRAEGGLSFPDDDVDATTPSAAQHAYDTLGDADAHGKPELLRLDREKQLRREHKQGKSGRANASKCMQSKHDNCCRHPCKQASKAKQSKSF